MRECFEYSHFILVFKIKLASKYELIIYALRNCNLNLREKFEPGPGFEPRTYRSQQAWRSTMFN